MACVYRSVYLSPHLDDVAFSCGGRIHRLTTEGHRVLVVTVFAGDEPSRLSELAGQVVATWKVDGDVMATRRSEDASANSILGAEYLHWPLRDCVFREDPSTGLPTYTSAEQILGPVDPSDLPVVGAIASRLEAIPDHEELCIPLAVGGHVDHVLTRWAGERVARPGTVYYEDFPYVFLDARRNRRGLRRALTKRRRWQEETWHLNEHSSAARLAAMSRHASQIEGVFGSSARMEAVTRRYISLVGGERIWRRRRPVE